MLGYCCACRGVRCQVCSPPHGKGCTLPPRATALPLVAPGPTLEPCPASVEPLPSHDCSSSAGGGAGRELVVLHACERTSSHLTIHQRPALHHSTGCRAAPPPDRTSPQIAKRCSDVLAKASDTQSLHRTRRQRPCQANASWRVAQSAELVSDHAIDASSPCAFTQFEKL